MHDRLAILEPVSFLGLVADVCERIIFGCVRESSTYQLTPFHITPLFQLTQASVASSFSLPGCQPTYTKPHIMSSTGKIHPKFGRAFRSHFLFGDDYLPMNHGIERAFSSFADLCSFLVPLEQFTDVCRVIYRNKRCLQINEISQNDSTWPCDKIDPGS
jgi:hypothetical protein